MTQKKFKCANSESENNFCAPGKKMMDGSCFSIEQLQKIANSFNIKYKSKQIIITNNKKVLLKSLIKNIQKEYNCNNERCWLGLDIVNNLDDDIKKNTLKPIGPSNSKKWLNTTDINNVLTQYQKKYHNFAFLGALPYDFEELEVLGIKNLNFNDLINRGKNQIGMVVNLDTHDKGGSHWVGLYSNFKNKQIYFFDSFGKKPGDMIGHFMNRIYNFMSKKYDTKTVDKETLNSLLENDNSDSDIDLKYNKIQHQFKNTECGVYSMNFIIRLVSGESFDNITNNITEDQEMQSCRMVYFR